DLRRAEAAIAQRSNADEVGQAIAKRKGASDALIALGLTEKYLYDTYHTKWQSPEQAGAAFVATPATSATVIPTHNLLKLVVAGLVGLLGGLFAVLLDRAVGIATKLEELWAYRELIRNMVMRDLKARYKSSILGYVWSLLNPLMMMLI